MFAKIRAEYDDITCVMEQIHAIFGSSAKATFSFGEINGVLLILLHLSDGYSDEKRFQKMVNKATGKRVSVARSGQTYEINESDF